VVHVSVPLHFVNEDKCKGVRLGGGSIAHVINEVEITCLPANLPEYIEVYMAELDLNEIIHLSDLALPEGVTIDALEHGDDRAVVSVTPPRLVSEEDEAEEAAAAAASAAAAEEDQGEDEEASED
jgi:large subunit ribosomal protein L25